MPTAVVSCAAFSFWIFDEETLIDGQDHISGGNSAPTLQTLLVSLAEPDSHDKRRMTEARVGAATVGGSKSE